MRPQTITILCVVLFLMGGTLFLRSATIFFMNPGIYTFLILIASIIALYCYYGLWYMKKWSIGLFYVIWIFIPLPLFMGAEGFSLISILRGLYFVALLVVFFLVVTPHKDKFKEESIWEFKLGGD